MITVIDGKNVYAYASVADFATGDATTIIMKTWDGTCDFSQAVDDFFSLQQVHEIDITVDQEGMTSLLAEPRTYVRAGVEIDGTAFAARQSCTDAGGDLASIHDPQTFELLSFAMLERLGIHQAWIGLNDRDSEGEFEWTDGSALDYLAWTSDSPKPWGDDEDCVLNAFWGWSDVGCSEEHAYICRE